MNNLTIKQKLLILGGLIVVSFFIIGGIYGYNISVQNNADTEYQRIVEIEYTVEEINVGMLKARRNEHDFFSQNDTDFVSAHKNSMSNVFELTESLKDLIQNSDMLRFIDDLNRLLTVYQNEFQKVVEVKEEVGLSHESGLQGNLRKSVHKIEDKLKQYNKSDLMVSMLMMRRHEKDYLFRGDNEYINKMSVQREKFEKMLEATSLPASEKSEITDLMLAYQNDFIALSNRMGELRRIIDTMEDSARQVEPIFENIHRMMQDLMAENQQRYNATHASIVTLMTVTLFVVGLLVVGGVWFLAQGIVSGVETSVKIAERISTGDLSVEINVTDNDEMSRLQNSMKTMVDRLRIIVGEVRDSSRSVLQASSEISSGNMELSQRTEEQASSLEETASSMEEMTTTVKESADNALQANSLATNTRDEARRGGDVVGMAVDAMNDIKRSSKKIADIINVVEDIAFQTNLLALNAAVEAARAGEQGRGFAVVASEVRTLAGRSAESAKEIRSLIEDSVEKVQTGADLVDASGKTLSEIVTSVAKVADIVSEMAAASQEQSAGIDQVNKAVLQMDQMTQQNSALVEEAASASRALQDQAMQLDQSIAFFKLDHSSMQSEQLVNNQHSNSARGVTTKHQSSQPASQSPYYENKYVSNNETSKGQSQKTGSYDNEWDEF